MKRTILFLLLLATVLSCTACVGEKSPQTSFFYLRSEDAIAYGQMDALVVPVPQDVPSGKDLDVLLQLYLDGPTEEDLRNPIPRGTHLLSTILEEDVLIIVLSREFSTLDGIQLTLAGACLAATCHGLTGIEIIQIRSGENTYEFDLDSFVFLDNSAVK